MITKEFLENHIRGLLKEKAEINTRSAAMGGVKEIPTRSASIA